LSGSDLRGPPRRRAAFPAGRRRAHVFLVVGCDLTRERTLGKRRERSSSSRRVGRSTESAHVFPAARGGCLLPPASMDRVMLDGRLRCKTEVYLLRSVSTQQSPTE
jgi:hypothetical protein